MSRYHRRILSIVVTSLFVVGALVMPAVHAWALAQSFDGSIDSDCVCHHKQQPVDPAGPDNGGGRGHEDHDASHCPMCQLAHAPVELAPTEATAGFFLPRGHTLMPLWHQPCMRSPRMIPFSCGPPA